MAGGLSTDDVIKRARSHFGETTELSVLDTTLREWVNDAIKDLYDALPATELRGLINESSLSLSSGAGPLESTWDRVVEITDSDSVPLHMVNPEVVRSIDLGTLWEPSQTVYALTHTHVLVRPTSVLSVNVAHMEPPALIGSADTTTDIETLTGINARWHAALVVRLTAFMYGQEEDWTSAEPHLNLWSQLIQGAWQQTGQLAHAEAMAQARRYGMAAAASEG